MYCNPSNDPIIDQNGKLQLELKDSIIPLAMKAPSRIYPQHGCPPVLLFYKDSGSL